ncbi:MAG: hypothetical protein PHN19_02450 [Patescibacteria group bacterium]|nr:hypothetical protein [Patescibacteria group bacterium]
MKKYLSKLLFCVAFLVFGILGLANESLAGSWNAVSTGTNSGINALAVYNNELYAGGSFTTAGGTSTSYIAKWNGTSWSAVGSGMNGAVHALAVDSTYLYAGGTFTTADGSSANYIAKWNGTSWSAVGTGMNGPIYSLAVHSSVLYAGGEFTTAGGFAMSNLAKWNGSIWDHAWSTDPDQKVSALTVFNDKLYAGGDFTNIGAHIAKLDTSLGWQTLSSGMNGSVLSLTADSSYLYVGGNYTTAGGSFANYIARWDGSSWSAIGSGMNGAVYSLVFFNSELYAGGSFTTADSSSANYIAKWNGTSWSALSSGMNSTVLALAVYNSELYAGGNFTVASGSSANYISKWVESTPTPTPEPTTVEIQQQNLVDGKKVKLKKALKKETISGQDLKLYFKKLPTKLTKGSKYYMKWRKSEKHPAKFKNTKKTTLKKVWTLKSNLKEYKAKKKKQKYQVKVTFQYTQAEFKALKRKNSLVKESNMALIVREKSGRWISLANYWKNAKVRLNIIDNKFTVYFNKIPKMEMQFAVAVNWNWSALDDSVVFEEVPGRAFYVTSSVVHNESLIIGGNFEMVINGSRMSNIAMWYENSWIPLGSGLGLNGTVTALASFRTELYAAVGYTVMKWDGVSWTRTGMQVANVIGDSNITSLVVYRNKLYAGGDFTLNYLRDGYLDNHSGIMVWDGVSWEGVAGDGVGFNGYINSMAVYDNELYILGLFNSIDGYESNNLAKWNGSVWSKVSFRSELYRRHIDNNRIGWGRLYAHNNKLYITGQALENGSEELHSYVYKWNGNSLSMLGSWIPGSIYALSEYNNKIYIGGQFFRSGTNEFYNVAVLNGVTWLNLNSVAAPIFEIRKVLTLADYNGELYAGGSFKKIGGISINYIARGSKLQE